MKIIGLTGGIGSGKTTVASMFKKLGVPVYIADVEARKLTNRSKVIKRKLIKLLGPKSYKDEKLNRTFVADIIFKNTELLQQVNDIIHPKVAAHFNRWRKKQNAFYCIKEAAILFENGGYKNCNQTILVLAPKEVRMQRVIRRDSTTIAAIELRMSHQWDDSKKKKLADIIIMNSTMKDTQKRVLEVHKILMEVR